MPPASSTATLAIPSRENRRVSGPSPGFGRGLRRQKSRPGTAASTAPPARRADHLTPGGRQPHGAARGNGKLWHGTLYRNFRGRSGAGNSTIVGQLKLPGAAFGLTAAFGYVWATDHNDGILLKVQPS